MEKTKIFRFGKPDGYFPDAEDDCYVYEVSMATGIDYLTLEALYHKKQKELHSEIPNDIHVINVLLAEFGYIYHGCYENKTIREFLSENKGEYVIYVDEHVTCAKKGFVFDRWDCSDEKVIGYFEISKNDLRNRKSEFDERGRFAISHFSDIQKILCLCDGKQLLEIGEIFGIKKCSFRKQNRYMPFLKHYLNQEDLKFCEFLSKLRLLAEVETKAA